MTYDVGNSGPGLGQARKCGRVKPDEWDPNLPLLVIGSLMVLQYTPSVSTIILSGPTYSSQNVRQI